MSKAATFTLSKPLKVGEDTYTEFQFRDATGGDLEDIALPPKMGDFLQLAARLADVTPNVMRALPAADAMKVAEVVAGFFEPSPPTGGK
jgi:hypothetical protein